MGKGGRKGGIYTCIAMHHPSFVRETKGHHRVRYLTCFAYRHLTCHGILFVRIDNEIIIILGSVGRMLRNVEIYLNYNNNPRLIYNASVIRYIIFVKIRLIVIIFY